MRTLTRILGPALVATLTVGAIAPAQAATPYEQARHEQTSRYAGSHQQADRHTDSRSAQIRSDINALRGDIDRAAARRVISPREAAGLRRDAAGIQRLCANYARHGLNNREMQTLQSRIDRVQAALHAEKHDGNGHRH